MAGKHDKIKDRDRFSILVPSLEKCMVCGTSERICLHEVFYGTANRKKSKEDGLIIPLCFHHHQETGGIHNNRQLDEYAKKQAEKIWIKTYSDKETAGDKIKDFIDRYGINYLDEEELDVRSETSESNEDKM